jgi:hypothetical protein
MENGMKTIARPMLLGLSLLLGACESMQTGQSTDTNPSRGTALRGLSTVLTPEEISSAGLTAFKDDVYIFFANDCPKFTFAVVPQCAIPDAICRKEGELVQFKPISVSGGPPPKYAVEFQTPGGFDPCLNSTKTPTSGTKTCKIIDEDDWPVEDMSLIIKYRVTPESGSCELDPYLVLER